MSKLLDDVRTVARLRHFSLRTEQAYTGWIRRYILFHHKRHPLEMGADEIRSFLADLAVKRLFSASTQTVALSALLFLYRDVLGVELAYVEEIERAKPSTRLARRLHPRGGASRPRATRRFALKTSSFV
jgi:hypothetical protein